jgi:hypothetical protein
LSAAASMNAAKSAQYRIRHTSEVETADGIGGVATV